MAPHGPGDAQRPRSGALLVAGPRLLDPNFMHTVILLCEHSPAGTFGLVLNRPTPLRVRELGSDLDLLRERDCPLATGGPVTPTEMHVLHGAGGVPGAVRIVPGVWLGGDPAVLHAALGGKIGETPGGTHGGTHGGAHEGPHGGAGEPAKFLLGYSGWGPGQLDAEIEEASWVVCPADAATVFDPRPETLWRRVLRAQGGRVAALADIPPDPSWN